MIQENLRMMNMINHNKEVIVEEKEVDYISNLPNDILAEIFKDISFRELAKTCVLSKRWKYFWTMHPILVLDREFLEEISGNAEMIEYGFSNIIDNIIFQHVGPIVKFVLDWSIIFFYNQNLDHIVLHVTRKYVKEFTLKIHNPNPYTLPFYIFNCATLTYLCVNNCIINPPYPTTLFPNLLELNLEFINFGSTIANCVLNTPLLSTLTFTACDGIHFLNMFAPRIEFLIIHESHEIHANFLKNFSNVRTLCMIIFLEESTNYKQGRYITWSRLLYLCSNLTRLALSNSCVEFLGAEIIPKRFPSKLDHLEHVKLCVEFRDLNQVSGVLSLIRSSPTLRSLKINVFSAVRRRNIRKVIRYLDDPNCVDQQFEKLEYVEVIDFEGTPCELYFLKLILAYSPSLSRMIIESSDELDGAEILYFYEELTMFVKASPRVDLIVLPHGSDVCRGEFNI